MKEICISTSMTIRMTVRDETRDILYVTRLIRIELLLAYCHTCFLSLLHSPRSEGRMR